MLELVGLPVGGCHALGDCAGALLVLQRDAIREAEDRDRIIRRELAAVGETGFDQEGIPPVDGRRRVTAA